MEGWLLRRGPAATTAAGLAAFAAAVHIWLTPHHLYGHGLYGALFIADSIGFLVATWWLFKSPSVEAWWFAGVVSAMTVVGFVLSRTTGLPGLHHEVWDFVGTVTTGAEGLIAIAAFLATRTRRIHATSGDPSARAGILARRAAVPGL